MCNERCKREKFCKQWYVNFFIEPTKNLREWVESGLQSHVTLIHFMIGIHCYQYQNRTLTKLTCTCSKSTIETIEKDVKYVRSYQVFVLLTSNVFHTLFYSFYCWILTSKWMLAGKRWNGVRPRYEIQQLFNSFYESFVVLCQH